MIKNIISNYVSSGKLMAMTLTYVFSYNTSRDRDLRHDFVQEIALSLLEYKYPEKLAQLYQAKQLDFFIMKIIRIQATSTNCRWHKLFGRYEKAKIELL